MGVSTAIELKQSVSGKRMFQPSLSTRHATEWPLTNVSSDQKVEVGNTSFALHKFPLVSKSGKIRKLISESKEPKVNKIHIQSTPGGSEAFQLAAKFCYGINTELNLTNIAMLRCASHHLQMTEDISDQNLELRSEYYLKETVFPSITNSITVLHQCESLLPIAEEINLTAKLISSISTNAYKEQLTSGLLKLESNPNRIVLKPKDHDWWGESLNILNLDFFQRVLSTLKSKGLKQDIISRILINYAHSNLHHTPNALENEQDKQRQRLLVEAIVRLLPTQSRKSPVPLAFLSGLLKTSVIVSPTCRGDLERRIALQLDQAILEDILILSASNHVYDTDSVVRIFSIFLNMNEEEDNNDDERRNGCYEFGSPRSPKQSNIVKVSKLLDSYLAEIALDSNLTTTKFIALAELLPDHARVVNDRLYRAVDIFLKVHPNIKELERYCLCKTIDCQKLSQDVCSHAAQNERLPVQMAVQVLYFEQIRLWNAMNGTHDPFFGSSNGRYPHRSGSGVGSGTISPRDNYASVRRENRELKLEVARMRLRLTDLEKDHVSMKQELVVRSNPANKILKSYTKMLSKLDALFRIRGVVKPMNPKAPSDARFLFQKGRRHSIS